MKTFLMIIFVLYLLIVFGRNFIQMIDAKSNKQYVRKAFSTIISMTMLFVFLKLADYIVGWYYECNAFVYYLHFRKCHYFND